MNLSHGHAIPVHIVGTIKQPATQSLSLASQILDFFRRRVWLARLPKPHSESINFFKSAYVAGKRSPERVGCWDNKEYDRDVQ